MFQKLKENFSEFGWGYVLFAALLALLGFCMIRWEGALEKATLAVGVCLIVFSVSYLVLTLADKNRGFRFALRLSLTVITLLGGAIVIFTRESTALLIISLCGLLLVVDGSFKLQTTAAARRFGSWSYWVLLTVAVLCIAGGYVLIRLTAQWLTTPLRFLGILLFVDAANNLLAPFYLAFIRRAADSEEGDIPSDPYPDAL